MKSLKKTVRSLVPLRLKSLVHKHRAGFLWSVHARGSFSQEGEDLLIERLTENWDPGFYVDVGAHHPHRFSNTHLLHLRGWSGINIDATPGSMAAFDSERPEAVNLEVAISDRHGVVEFHMFDEPALNTTQNSVLDQRTDENWIRRGSRPVAAMPLAAVLDEHLPRGTTIDVMSVDVEGSDLDVLRSNDWSLYRPRLLVVEQWGCNLLNLESDPIFQFLAETGYLPVAKLVNTVVYRPRSDGERDPAISG